MEKILWFGHQYALALLGELKVLLATPSWFAVFLKATQAPGELEMQWNAIETVLLDHLSCSECSAPVEAIRESHAGHRRLLQLLVNAVVEHDQAQALRLAGQLSEDFTASRHALLSLLASRSGDASLDLAAELAQALRQVRGHRPVDPQK